jgi:hypothetical protein
MMPRFQYAGLELISKFILSERLGPSPTVELVDQNKKEAEKKMIKKSVSAFLVVIIIALVVAIIGRYYI